MKKTLFFLVLLTVFLLPTTRAHASVFEEMVSVIKDLGKQITSLVASHRPAPVLRIETATSTRLVYQDKTLGFQVTYPEDWKPTTIFATTKGYEQAVAFVRISREDFLKKLVRPNSETNNLILQDTAIFLKPAGDDPVVTDPAAYRGKVSTSTVMIGETAVPYILETATTNPNKFGGGSTERYLFTVGSTTIVAEANYSEVTPNGPLHDVFIDLLSSFTFGTSTNLSATSTTATSTGALTPTGGSAMVLVAASSTLPLPVGIKN